MAKLLDYFQEMLKVSKNEMQEKSAACAIDPPALICSPSASEISANYE